MSQRMYLSFFCAIIFATSLPLSATAAEVVQDTTYFIKAQVVEVVSQEVREVPGTGTKSIYQTIKAKLLEGSQIGEVILFDNDYLTLKTGDLFYAMHTVNELEGRDTYAVSEPYRIPVLVFFAGLFLACLLLFGGWQGIRGLLALIFSFICISYLLLPGILHGFSPVLVSIAVAGVIIVIGSYVTHGFTRTTTSAVLGMLVTVVVTGILSYIAIHWGHFTGYTNEEATYLNFNTRGSIDFVGLLLGSLLIGFLGVLYDAAIGQAIAVEELLRAGKQMTRREVYARALRIGREHIGALVNTLAIAYVGASLPLLLLFITSTTQSPIIVINQELFATEIIRILIGSTGLILAVPLTTLVAVYLVRLDGTQKIVHSHKH